MHVTVNLSPLTPKDHPALRPILAAALEALSLDAPPIGPDDYDFPWLDLLLTGSDIRKWLFVTARCRGSSTEICFQAMKRIWDAAAERNRQILVRCDIETDSLTDFTTGRIEHRGYVRFTVSSDEGEIARPVQTEGVEFIGLPNLKG